MTRLRLFLDFRFFALALIGFASALPAPLLGSTLSIRLADQHLSHAVIGLFALLHLPQNFKFLWGSLIDHTKCPLFSRFGQRLSWAIFSYLGCLLSFLLMNMVDPVSSTFLFGVLVFVAATFAGFIYLIGVSYEVEILAPDEYEKGSACVIAGYRVGLIVATAGVLYIAEELNWNLAYSIISFLLLLPLLALFFLKPKPLEDKPPSESKSYQMIAPIVDFFKNSKWATFLFVVILYGVGTDFASSMLGPFYLKVGFTKSEIATSNKICGMAATLLGVSMAGFFPNFLRKPFVLIICGLFQTLGWFLHFHLFELAPSIKWLYVISFLEHLAGGITITLFIAYLWNISRPNYVSSKYAFLWALFGVKKSCLACLGGWSAAYLGWGTFIAFTTLISLLSLPALFIMGLTLCHHNKRLNPSAL